MSAARKLKRKRRKEMLSSGGDIPSVLVGKEGAQVLSRKQRRSLARQGHTNRSVNEHNARQNAMNAMATTSENVTSDMMKTLQRMQKDN